MDVRGGCARMRLVARCGRFALAVVAVAVLSAVGNGYDRLLYYCPVRSADCDGSAFAWELMPNCSVYDTGTRCHPWRDASDRSEAAYASFSCPADLATESLRIRTYRDAACSDAVDQYRGEYNLTMCRAWPANSAENETVFKAFCRCVPLENAMAAARHGDNVCPYESSSPSPSTSAPPSASPSAEAAEPACFAADATVELEDGRLLRMDEVSIGDRVRVGANRFSEVYMWGHRERRHEAHASARRLVFAHRQPFVASASHDVWVADARVCDDCSGSLSSMLSCSVTALQAPLASVKPGNFIFYFSRQKMAFDSVKVTRVERLATLSGGLFSPLTLDGGIVVDAVLASCYTQAVRAHIAHALLAPARTAFRLFGPDLFEHVRLLHTATPHTLHFVARALDASASKSFFSVILAAFASSL